MDPPSSKKRKYPDGLPFLLSQEEEKDMGIQKQSMGPMVQPISKIRFKDINSNVFEYTHMVRRVQAAVPTLTCSGASASTGGTGYSLTSLMAGLIPDIGNLDNIYERIRITRVQWEFTPTLNDQFSGPSVSTAGAPMVAYWCPQNAQQALNPPTSWADIVDEPQAKITKGNSAFVVDSLPVVCEQITTYVDGVGATSLSYNDLEAPWLPCAAANVTSFYSGVVNWYQPQGIAAYTSQVFYISVITWFDLDTVR